MTTQHTPGPWRIGPHQQILSQGWSIRIGDDSAIAYVLGKENPELRANARLIAAAPSLYEYVASKANCGDNEALKLLEMIHGRT